jgi:hypothetical protein
VQFVDRIQRYLTLLEWQPGESVAATLVAPASTAPPAATPAATTPPVVPVSALTPPATSTSPAIK